MSQPSSAPPDSTITAANASIDPAAEPERSLAPGQPFRARLVVESDLAGTRIDHFLVEHFRNYTKWRMQRLVRAGAVRIEGVPADGDARVYEGQHVEVRLLEPPDYLLPPEPAPLDILHEDEWMIVLNKAAGQVVHPCGMYATGSLANHLQAWFDSRTPLRGLVRPGVVHRLDRLTSGVICFSKDHHVHRKISMAFELGQVSKAYLTLVQGRVPHDRGDVNVPIGNTPGKRTIMMSTRPDAVDARPSRTFYEVLRRFERCTLVRCKPITGRLHQIRVHMAHIGYPVLADEFYSDAAYVTRSGLLSSPGDGARRDGPDGDGADDPILLDRQALHAEQLSLLHPILGEVLTFSAPLADDMQRVVDLLERSEGPTR
jgi:23S rRNA pseudouridine1911/1915/1917 synthase